MTEPPTSRPATAPSGPHAVLVPGFWLGGWAWWDVEPRLRDAGITPHAVTLPGLDGSPSEGLNLDDHVDAVLGLVEGLEGDVVLVGHSGGGIVVQCAVDRDPSRFRRVVYVDSGPLRDGMALRPDATDDLPLPSWEELEAQQSSTEGMDDEARATFRARAVPHPAGVAASTVHLHDEARFDVPVTVVCTSLPSTVLGQMIEAGQMPSELPSVHDVRYVDLPTGHWPMFSRPADLAAVLADEILAP